VESLSSAGVESLSYPLRLPQSGPASLIHTLVGNLFDRSRRRFETCMPAPAVFPCVYFCFVCATVQLSLPATCTPVFIRLALIRNIVLIRAMLTWPCLFVWNSLVCALYNGGPWYVRVDFVEARERKHYEWSLPCVTARLGHAPRHQSSANDDA